MMDKQKTKNNTKSKHSLKHVEDVPVSKRRKLLIVIKIILYSFVWLMVWGAIAFGIAVALILSIVFSIASDGVITPQQANNSVLVAILIIGALFLGTVWLMRKAKSLFYRTSRYVLLVCTVIGLLAGIPMSLLGVWQPDVKSSNSTTSADALKRYQYMLCTDGSSQHYTDEQMKDPNTGFVDGSEDYCKERGHGKMLRLTNNPEDAKSNSQESAVGQQHTSTQKYAPTSGITSSQQVEMNQYYANKKKNQECSDLWQRYYEEPKSQLEYSLGGKPSMFDIPIDMVGHELEVAEAEYNQHAKTWNDSLKKYEHDYDVATRGKNCSNPKISSGYDFDKVSIR